MGVAFVDDDGDGLVDVFVSNDTYRNFAYFTTSTTGLFAKRASNKGAAPIVMTENL